MVVDQPSNQLENLTKAFAYIENLPPCIPNSCIGYLEDHEPTSVDITNDTKYFAAGFSNSEIHVWSLTALGVKISSNAVHPGVYLNPLRLNIPAEDFALNAANGNGGGVETSPSSRVNILKGEKSPSGASMLRGHSGPIYGLAFANANANLISCSEDATIRLWDLDACKNTHVYSGHMYPVWCLDTSPLEIYFATGSRDTTARLWTFDRLFPLRIFAGHLMDVDVVKFHPNAIYIATGSPDKTVSWRQKLQLAAINWSSVDG